MTKRRDKKGETNNNKKIPGASRDLKKDVPDIS